MNTSHCWHSLTFSSQLFWICPLQKVPLINQQGELVLSSQAAQLSLHSIGQSVCTQQEEVFLPLDLFRDSNNKSCLSVFTGIFLHPCSKLWTALVERHNNCANSFWLLSKDFLIFENVLLSILFQYTLTLQLYHNKIPQCS